MRTMMMLALVLGGGLSAAAQDRLPVVAREDFENGADRWEPSDPSCWQIKKTDSGNLYSLVKNKAAYKPPHRSPVLFSLLKGVTVGDFELEVRVQSTIKDYGHRDLCLFFGYQDPAHFYYVHFGKKTDDHANQIFIVNDKPRTKISTKTTKGTPWDDDWHRLKVLRRVADGTIETYYDDMEKPVMVARDKTFTWGRIGVGSFDDTGNFDDLVLRGVEVKK